MCLGIPGKIIKIYKKNGTKMGEVEFGKIKREVCLSFTPEAKPGDYVIVHVGFAISIVDEKEAIEIFKTFNEISKIENEVPNRIQE